MSSRGLFTVNEIFYSLQGEGHYSGTPTVFCRFSGCNLWSGRAEDKGKSPCVFCDTDFRGGNKFTEVELVEAILLEWGGRQGVPRVTFTGGEPALQLTSSLINALKKKHCNVSVETNGTLPLPSAGPYWITVSPKTKNLEIKIGHELKVLWPNKLVNPDEFSNCDFQYKYLQPIWDDSYDQNLASAIRYCLENPSWRLSLQTHKLIGVR